MVLTHALLRAAKSCIFVEKDFLTKSPSRKLVVLLYKIIMILCKMSLIHFVTRFESAQLLFICIVTFAITEQVLHGAVGRFDLGERLVH